VNSTATILCIALRMFTGNQLRCRQKSGERRDAVAIRLKTVMPHSIYSAGVAWGSILLPLVTVLRRVPQERRRSMYKYTTGVVNSVSAWLTIRPPTMCRSRSGVVIFSITQVRTLLLRLLRI
jgi:hypothetical protein